MSGGPGDEPSDEGGVPYEVREHIIEEFERRAGDLIEGNQAPELLRRLGSVLKTSVNITRTHITETSKRGGFPDPQDLERYEAINPGSADRILAMAEKAQDAEIRLALDANKRTDRYQLLALAAGFVGLLLILVVAYALAIQGKEWVAGAVLGIGVVGVIGTLVNAPFASRPRSPGPDEDSMGSK